MRFLSPLALPFLALVLSGTPSVEATPTTIKEFERRALTDAIVTRALAQHAARQLQNNNNQSSFAPATNQPCPLPSGTSYVRPATSISRNETDYINERLQNAKTALADFFSRSKVSVDGGIDSLLSNTSTIPRVAVAVSGGGYRAMLHGSGGLAALDARNQSSSSVAGLLQGSLYMTGLSGGSWAVTSFTASDMASPYYLDSAVWNLQQDIITPSGVFDTVGYYADVVSDVLDKRSAGFDTSITDLWARALSYHLFDQNTYPDHAATTSFGVAIRNTSSFRNHQMPYPIVIALEREPGQLIVGQNASIFSFDPYEFGSFEPLGGGALGGTRGAFVPIDYLGTRWDDGKIGDNQCTTGFDNIGYVVATSATLFNLAYIQISESSDTSGVIANAIQSAIEKILGSLSSDNNDIAPYPNPWHNWEPSTNAIANLTQISMVDGGEALDNIPIWPLLNPQREVDFIMAFDSSADTDYYWPNGTAMIATWNRTTVNSRNYSMPNVPTNPNTWVNNGYNARPTFFGCNASDVTNFDENKIPAPVIAYIPAYPWSTFANTSTYQLSYEPDASRAHLDNGLRSTTLNDTVSDWPACLACAAVKRAVERAGRSHSEQCQKCYSTWCWDGSTNDTQPEQWNPWLGSLPKFVADLTGQSQITPNTVRPPSGKNSALSSWMISPILAAVPLVVMMTSMF